MNILFVSNNLGQGGKERQMHELLKFFLATTDFRFGLCLREPIVKYNLAEIGEVKLYKPSVRLSPLQFAKHVSVAIREFKPDIIHTWEGGTAFITTILTLISFKNIPMIDGTLRYSNTFAKTTKYYWMERFNRAIAKRVVANSNAGLKSIDYVKKNKYLVIPNGMNFSRFNLSSVKSEVLSGETFVGMIASFSKPKDYKSLIEVVISLLNKSYSIRLILVGDGPEKKYCQGLVPEKYRSNIEFTGNVADPEKFLAKMNIALLLNKKNESEGMSNSIMEYMAFGLPVICTNTGGNSDMVKDGVNGFLTQHENSYEIEKRLEQLINDPELRINMGKHSLAIAQADFEIERVGKEYLKLYNGMLSIIHTIK